MASPLILRAKEDIALARSNLIIAVSCGMVLAALAVAFFI